MTSTQLDKLITHILKQLNIHFLHTFTHLLCQTYVYKLCLALLLTYVPNAKMWPLPDPVCALKLILKFH